MIEINHRADIQPLTTTCSGYSLVVDTLRDNEKYNLVLFQFFGGNMTQREHGVMKWRSRF